MIRTLFATLASLVLSVSLATASIQDSGSPYESTGLSSVDAAIAAYAEATAAWEAADDATKEDAQTAMDEAEAAAVAAIDQAQAAMESGTDAYKQLSDLRLEVSGEIDAKDIGALARLAERYATDAKDWAIANGPGWVFKLILVVIIWIAFKIIAGIAARVVKKGLSTPKIKASNLLKDFIVGVARKVVLAIGVLVILSQFGVNVGPLLAGLGVAGFVLGFALQDTLGNFAAGLMILFYRPYDVGDVVNAGGVMGSVDAMSLVSTTIKTPDNQTLIVPNSAIWGGVIQNVTANPTRRVDLVFGIGYDDDMAQAETILRRVVEAHDKVLKDPAVNIRVHELADSSVNFIVRPWCKTSDYWDVYWDLTRQVKEAFDADGVSIPFPQRDVHLHTVEPQG
ncbi:MAG: mechanosensitive ion channel family protein [Planctomycetota bacterium]